MRVLHSYVLIMNVCVGRHFPGGNMRRSEQREHIFKLLFMTQFNTENEMPEQLSIYFEGLGEVSEKIRKLSSRNTTTFWNIWKKSTES